MHALPHFNVSIKLIVYLYFAAFPPRPARVSADHNISSHLRGRSVHDQAGKRRTVTCDPCQQLIILHIPNL